MTADTACRWSSRLAAAVSPLELGVAPLRLAGYRPPGREDRRPGRTAAVLVPIVTGARARVILTVRSAQLSRHAGQVSFPGGAADPGDVSGVATALREAHEEIGLASSAVRPLGFLDRYDTVSDYRVLPVVGLVAPGQPLVADGVEVSTVFEVPLATALDPGRYQSEDRQWRGRRYRIHRLEWGGHVIWGATAAILLDLAHRVAETPP